MSKCGVTSGMSVLLCVCVCVCVCVRYAKKRVEASLKVSHSSWVKERDQ